MRASSSGVPEHIETFCATVDEPPGSITRPVSMPIVAASVFTADSLDELAAVSTGQADGFVYERGGHPNQAVLERVVARLEGAEAGVACASGMGALTAALLPGMASGDRIVADAGLYGRTAALLAGPLQALGVRSEFVDLTDNDAAARALAEPATAVIVESASNPLLAIPDIARLAQLAHRAGARLIVDNTVATPYHCRPLMHGADIAVHSGSKYLSGHSDAMTGIVVGTREFMAKARAVTVTLGAPAGAFDCWLTARGIKTLALRMAQASAGAAQIAAFLAGQEGVVLRVSYPGLRAHPQHRRACRLFERGYGALIGVQLAGGAPAAAAFVGGLRRICLAPSFGDVSTTVAYPAGMEEREGTNGVCGERPPPGLVRLSIGVEHPDDIIADLRLGLIEATRTAGGATR